MLSKRKAHEHLVSGIVIYLLDLVGGQRISEPKAINFIDIVWLAC